MKKFLLGILCLFFVLSISVEVYAKAENSILEKQFDLIDIENFDSRLKQINRNGTNEYVEEFSLKDTVTKLITSLL
jgi:hypothetical protein